jgi:hypothetical protein
MKDYQERVIVEKDELDEKVKKLDAFLTDHGSSVVPVEERKLLVKQLAFMAAYSGVLADRIATFS